MSFYVYNRNGELHRITELDDCEDILRKGVNCMKPRKVVVQIELVTDMAVKDLKEALKARFGADLKQVQATIAK